jgi:hypothetical protein
LPVGPPEEGEMNATRAQLATGPWTADEDQGSDPDPNKDVGGDKKPEKKEE